MDFKKIKIILIDSVKNLFSNDDLFYIVEPQWSIMWDGRHITDYLNKNNFLNSVTRYTHFGLKNKIIHFGSINTFVGKNGIRNIDDSNKKILTWFHIDPNSKAKRYISDINEKADIIHTSCEITKKELLNYGVEERKIKVIPLGIDLKIFRKYDVYNKRKVKEILNLPKNKIIIGSFQKDGTGWGEGNTLKKIKGPDIFCDVVERIAKKHRIHILLTGPARGYVINRLKDANITFTHKYLDDYLKIVDYYNALDIYLMTSRVEGGPKSVLESWATGIPFVGTKVGMVNDIAKHKNNALLSEVNDVNSLEKNVDLLILDKKLCKKISDNAYIDVKNYSYNKIINDYYNEIYKKLLDDD